MMFEILGRIIFRIRIILIKKKSDYEYVWFCVRMDNYFRGEPLSRTEDEMCVKKLRNSKASDLKSVQ